MHRPVIEIVVQERQRWLVNSHEDVIYLSLWVIVTFDKPTRAVRERQLEIILSILLFVERQGNVSDIIILSKNQKS